MNENRRPTNVAFVDRILCGGTKPFGVYGILSPTGVGKSTLATMIASNGAICPGMSNKQWEETTRPWVYFDLHNGESYVLARIASHVFRSPREDYVMHAGNGKGSALQSESGVGSDANRGVSPQEKDEISRRLRRSFKLITEGTPLGRYSFSGDVGAIDAVLGMYGRDGQLGGIVIDGARQVWYASREKFQGYEAQFYEDLVSRHCRKWAERSGCPLWITHQVRAAMWNAPPTERFTHRDAADCKAFCDGMDACLVLGNATPPGEGSVFSICCVKGESDQVRQDRILLTHDPVVSSIVPVNGYVEDRKARTWRKVLGKESLLDEGDRRHVEELRKRLGDSSTPSDLPQRLRAQSRKEK